MTKLSEAIDKFEAVDASSLSVLQTARLASMFCMLRLSHVRENS